MSVENRRHFRIKYPPEDRPKLEIAGQLLPVVDLSESGLKLIGNPNFRPGMRQEIKGRLIFFDNTAEQVQGQVVRLVGDFVMVTLKKPIPVARLRIEADRLIARYGEVQQAKPHQ